jgi:superfamily II DNA/RNA helicase
MSFDDLGLSPQVLKAVVDSGYTTPTPIQRQAIPVVLQGRDVLGCAQTGTGKTAGFTLPMIDILAGGRARARMPRSLILEPTRELAQQVAESFEKYGKYHKLNRALLIGGTSMSDQEAVLSRGVDVLIATPGRLLDLIERGKILLADVKLLVIDEADRMLDMGFIPDIEKIVGRLPVLRQTLFFSATMPPEIKRLAEKFLSNPKEISVDKPATAAVTVEQRMVKVPQDDKAKRDVLRQLLRDEDIGSALIFCNRKRDVATLHRSLERHGFDAKALHGDMSQPARTETLEGFRAGKFKLLVCSDVAARGLDIPAVSHVFNFDVPIHAEDYVHRIGRTGRAGRSGKSFTLAQPSDSKYLAAIKRQAGGKAIPDADGTIEAVIDAAPTLNGHGELPRAETERKGRGRGRSDRRGEKPRGERRPERTAAERPVEQAVERPAELTAERPVEHQTERPAERPAARHSERQQDRRERGHDRGRGAERDRRPSDRPHHPTESFGDHTPAFLLKA